MRRLDQAHARSKAELAAQEKQLAELEEQVWQLRREARAAKKERRQEDDNPPSYQEAVEMKEAQVAQKQTVVAAVQQRTMEEDILIATIPAVFAARKCLLGCHLLQRPRY